MLPIDRQNLPDNIPIKDALKILSDSGGQYGKRPKPKQIIEDLKKDMPNLSDIWEKQSYGHLPRHKFAEFIKYIQDKYDMTDAGKKIFREKINQFNQPAPTPPPLKKTYSPRFIPKETGQLNPSDTLTPIKKQTSGLPPTPNILNQIVKPSLGPKF